MTKFNIFLILFLFGMLGFTSLRAQHHGLGLSLGGGMVNTINDHGQQPDVGTFSMQGMYLFANKKEDKKFYSLTRLGAGYELAGSFQGFSLFADSGVVLFDLWRIGAGLQAEFVTSLDSLLKNGVILMPYLETAIMWQAFKNSGFDFGFKLGAPVKVTPALVDPFYKENKMDQLNWQFSVGYFHFFGGEK